MSFLKNKFILKNSKEEIIPDIKSLYFKYSEELKPIYFDEIIQISWYSDFSKKKLLNIKLYHKKNDLKYFLKYLDKALINLDNIVKLDKNKSIITYVPLNFFQYVYRWYSHVFLTAKELSKISKLNLESCFKKNLSFKKQSSLNKQDRHDNLKNRFSLKKNISKSIKNKDIILVDDIIASGVTINLLSKLLKDAWARNIYIIVLSWSTWQAL